MRLPLNCQGSGREPVGTLTSVLPQQAFLDIQTAITAAQVPCAGRKERRKRQPARDIPPIARGLLIPYGRQGRDATTGRYSLRAKVEFRQAAPFLPSARAGSGRR